MAPEPLSSLGAASEGTAIITNGVYLPYLKIYGFSLQFWGGGKVNEFLQSQEIFRPLSGNEVRNQCWRWRREATLENNEKGGGKKYINKEAGKNYKLNKWQGNIAQLPTKNIELLSIIWAIEPKLGPPD